MSDIHDLHRRYDGPVPQKNDAAKVQADIIADLQRQRDRVAWALEKPWDVADERRMRESLKWYDEQLTRINAELAKGR